MKFNKMPHLLILLTSLCVVLLSGCGATNNSGSSAIAKGHIPTVASTVRPTSSAQSVSSTTLPADCPAAGTMRAVNLPTETSATQPAVFYLTEWGGVQSGLHPLNLMRYDLTTGKTTSIFSLHVSRPRTIHNAEILVTRNGHRKLPTTTNPMRCSRQISTDGSFSQSWWATSPAAHPPRLRPARMFLRPLVRLVLRVSCNLSEWYKGEMRAGSIIKIADRVGERRD
jgi:hypothetical protein